MKKRKKRNLQGTVLFTTVSVMALLILFLVGTLTLASASNNRAHKSYASSQANYTARATIENFTQAMIREPGVAAAVYNLSETPGSVIYPEVNVGDTTIGHIGCYDVNSGAWNDNHISVESIQGTDFVYMDNEGRQFGAIDFDDTNAQWSKLSRVKVSATVRVGREEETVVAYINKQSDRTATLSSSAPQVKGIQLVGAAGFPAGRHVTGGLGVALGKVTGNEVSGMRNSMDIDTTLTFINSSIVWNTNTSQINIKKPDLHDANGNPVAATLPYSQTVITGSLCVNNDKFINIDYDMPDGYSAGTWSNKEVPYIYIDGALVAGSQFNINDLRHNGAPFNMFVGTFNGNNNPITMPTTNLYMMDSYDASKTYTVYQQYDTNSNTPQNPTTVIKGDNVFGGPGNSTLSKWTYSVANGTDTSAYDVGGSIFCKGNLKIGNATIAGDVRVEGDCNVTDNLRIDGRLIVGGTLSGELTKINATGGIFSTGGTGKSSHTPGSGVSVDDYINETSGTITGNEEGNTNVTRENFYVPAGKVDPFALEEVAPNAYGSIEYFKWRPDDHINAEGLPVDAFGNPDVENTSTILYYRWDDRFEPTMFGSDMINKFLNNEEFNHMSYEDAMNDPEFAAMKEYLVNEPYTETTVPFNQYDGSSDHYFGTPRVRDDRTIYTCGVPAAEGETYFYNIDEGQIWTQSEINEKPDIEEHYIRANLDGTRSTENVGMNKYTHYIGGSADNYITDNEADTEETAPVTTAAVTTTTAAAETTTAAPVVVNPNLPSDIREIYPSDMQREKIYGYFDESGEFYVEPSTKIITNVSEARHALGLNPDGEINPDAYPTTFPSAPTAQAYVGNQRNPEVWEGNSIVKDCVISGEIPESINIKAKGSDMFIVLDNTKVTNVKEIVVETTGPASGNVYFIVKGELFLDNSVIRPSTYHDGTVFDYNTDWGVIFYGTVDSSIRMQNDCLVVGSFKMPASTFIPRTKGRPIKVKYTDEEGIVHEPEGNDNNPYPTLVGNAIFKAIDTQNAFANYYTAAGASGGGGVGGGTPIVTAMGTFILQYMLAS